MVIKVFSTASSLQLGLFLSLPATAVILVALMVACLWRRTSPSSLTRTHSLVNIHQPHLPSRSNLLCPPSSQKKMGRYSMISLPMEIPDLVSSAALQNLMEGSSSLPRYTSSPHVGVQQQHCPVLPGARNLPPSSSSAHGVSPIPRTVAGLHRQSIHSLPGSQLISNVFYLNNLVTTSPRPRTPPSSSVQPFQFSRRLPTIPWAFQLTQQTSATKVEIFIFRISMTCTFLKKSKHRQIADCVNYEVLAEGWGG